MFGGAENSTEKNSPTQKKSEALIQNEPLSSKTNSDDMASKKTEDSGVTAVHTGTEILAEKHHSERYFAVVK